jgi:hypothetical protein
MSKKPITQEIFEELKRLEYDDMKVILINRAKRLIRLEYPNENLPMLINIRVTGKYKTSQGGNGRLECNICDSAQELANDIFNGYTRALDYHITRHEEEIIINGIKDEIISSLMKIGFVQGLGTGTGTGPLSRSKPFRLQIDRGIPFYVEVRINNGNVQISSSRSYDGWCDLGGNDPTDLFLELVSKQVLEHYLRKMYDECCQEDNKSLFEVLRERCPNLDAQFREFSAIIGKDVTKGVA